eukprot:gene33164-8107_t
MGKREERREDGEERRKYLGEERKEQRARQTEKCITRRASIAPPATTGRDGAAAGPHRP